MQRVQFRLSTLLLGLVIVGQLCTFAAAWLQRPRPEPIVLGPPLAGGLAAPAILSVPPVAGRAGAIYCYQAQAEGARWQLLSGPQSMNCTAGGLVLWVPRCRGDYPVELAAIGEDGGYTVQAFVVHVR